MMRIANPSELARLLPENQNPILNVFIAQPITLAVRSEYLYLLSIIVDQKSEN